MKISKLIDYYVDGELLLPEMQRKYVWKSTQIRDLIDSIYRDYPSGSILLWETDILPETRATSLKVDNKQNFGQKFLLLDGQQRITSLATIMTGHPIRIKEGGEVIVHELLHLRYPKHNKMFNTLLVSHLNK